MDWSYCFRLGVMAEQMILFALVPVNANVAQILGNRTGRQRHYLADRRLGTREIAVPLGCTRNVCKRALGLLNVYEPLIRAENKDPVLCDGTAYRRAKLILFFDRNTGSKKPCAFRSLFRRNSHAEPWNELVPAFDKTST